MTNSLPMHVRILSPLATLFDGEAQSCLLPTPEGPMKVLPRHMPVTGCISTGNITVKLEGGASVTHATTCGGFYRVTQDHTHIWLSDL